MCQACRSGPAGREGHSALNEEFRSGVGPGGEPAYVLFGCVTCGCVWSRLRGGAPGYVWQLKIDCGGFPRPVPEG